MQFVIAGNYAEYKYNFANKSPLDPTVSYIFISDPMRLYGMRDVKVICIGHYWKSPVYKFHFPHRLTKNIRFVNEVGKEVSAFPSYQ